MLVEAGKGAEIVPAVKKPRSQTFYRLLSYAKPDTLQISLGLSALVVNSITNLSFPWLIGQALDHAHIEDLQSFLLKSGGYFLFGSLASWLRVYCLGSALENIVQRIRLDLFDSLLYQDLEYYESSRTGM
ncbi:ABC transporter ATP-binding protein [archaeon]|nr:MAG: ABC transporter ATP-binding protein [archaeon]